MAMKRSRILIRVTYFIFLAIFSWLVLGPLGARLENLPLRIGVFCLLVLGATWLFRQAWPEHGWGMAGLATALASATIYKLASFIPAVSTYPLSLDWSEASRYYYASLFFSQRLYGIHLPPSVLHPTRYLMQAVPFLISGAPLWLHRLWQVILWVVTAALTGWLLVRRLPEAHGSQKTYSTRWVITCSLLFAFLFLFQGPIYYHLLVMPILVLWGFDRRHFWRSLGVVLVASAWAGVSRVNWLPMPGLLAAALYFLEQPVRGEPEASASKKTLLPWRYLLPPVIWTAAGTLLGYAVQQAYKLWSGNPPELFGSSFTSDLLWYRLLPNPTFPLGILPSAVLVSLPLVLLAVLRLRGRAHNDHPLRLLGLAGILLVLFLGGVVVSVKIGGGSNLHNLDASLVMLLVISSYIFFGAFQPETQGQEISVKPIQQLTWLNGLLVAAVVAIPVYFALSTGGQLPEHDFTAAQAAVETIHENAQNTVQGGGQVLFISQRQLLTFHLLDDQPGDKPIPLVPEYELVFLMEMAMAGNRTYLDAFQQDIQNQRFALIISGPLNTKLQGSAHSFGEENDAWVKEVSEPVLCYYEPLVTMKQVAIQILAPRQKACR